LSAMLLLLVMLSYYLNNAVSSSYISLQLAS
jgi:hypothetical protein